MVTYKIRTSTGVTIETQNRGAAAYDYVRLVRFSHAMNGAMSGESVTMWRDGQRILEHFGRKHLQARVETRLVELDSSAAPDDNALNL